MSAHVAMEIITVLYSLCLACTCMHVLNIQGLNCTRLLVAVHILWFHNYIIYRYRWQLSIVGGGI